MGEPQGRHILLGEDQTLGTTEVPLTGNGVDADGRMDVSSFERGSIQIVNTNGSRNVTVRVYVSNRLNPASFTGNPDHWVEITKKKVNANSKDERTFELGDAYITITAKASGTMGKGDVVVSGRISRR